MSRLKASAIILLAAAGLERDGAVFIAGCGTGRQAILATLMLDSGHTLAVDLSRTSLAYAARKTRELGISDRITYAQADIMELSADLGPFDVVQSTGVLHHMDDPFEGARKVCRLAKPGGFVAMGLYSALAREHLKPGKALGKSYTPETVRAFRQAIIEVEGEADFLIVDTPGFDTHLTRLAHSLGMVQAAKEGDGWLVRGNRISSRSLR